MNKGPDAFRTISEVAEDLDIPQHVLRFWETRFTSIRPLKRGGGRRYYRPDDVELLRGIRQLLYGQGYTIKGVQRILKEDGLGFVQGVGRGETLALPMPAEADDDLGAEEPDPGAAERRSASREGDESFAAEPSLAPAPGRSQALSGRERDLLRAALDELLECQRALETLSLS